VIKNILIFSLLFCAMPVQAKIDLVTLPTRNKVQLTVYNPADLTLVREQRTLTLAQGINRLEFSWAGTLIDPTSVYLEAPKHTDKVVLKEITYPANVEGSAVWTIESKVAGEVPVEIGFFTSGIRWESFYMLTLTQNEQAMQLQNYVKIQNNSGEDYSNAQTRVVVGRIGLLDEIATLAKRSPPFGSPVPVDPAPPPMLQRPQVMRAPPSRAMRSDKFGRDEGELYDLKPKEIVKEGLSEYFLYTIEGTETIPTNWSKRLMSLDVSEIPIRSLYRYDENLYGKTTQRFLYFKNDAEHHLGDTPLPDGKVMVYRHLPELQHLSYVGGTTTRYIPVGQEVELNLGVAQDVRVKPVLMDYQTRNYLFDDKGNIIGHERVETHVLTLENHHYLPADLEIVQHIKHPHWSIENSPDLAAIYQQVDIDTVKYTLTLPAYSRQEIRYTLLLKEEGSARRAIH
jgi:hypothetical protein